jgi:hypothetical protein
MRSTFGRADGGGASLLQIDTPACPQELTLPVLHKVLNYEPLKAHVWGGKGVGSQAVISSMVLPDSAN